MDISKLITWIRVLIKDQKMNDGHDIFEYDSFSTFNLSEDFIDSTSIIVHLNGEQLDTDDWSYNSTTNQITIDLQGSGNILVTDDFIEIFYSYYSKYSDSEIEGYISASLLYWSQYKINRVFSIDESDNIVVAENSENPTTSEGHIIALISAILISPNNIRINTPDISQTGVETLSKSEQINHVFFNYKRFVGSLSFLEECDNG